MAATDNAMSPVAGVLTGIPWRTALALRADNAMSPVAGVLTVTGKRCHCTHRVEEFPADFGRGFMLFKLDAGSDQSKERYACQVGRGVRDCECRGFISTGASSILRPWSP